MNLLITGAWNCSQEQQEYIIGLGHRIFFLQYENESLPLDYADVEGVICNGLFGYHAIEKFVNLRYIQLTSAGLDRVPVDYINKKGISLYNARGVYSIPMAEFAVAGVLQLYKQSSYFAQNQAKGLWRKHREILELYGKTVCIVGCGSVGTECAKRFAAFDCQVIGIDEYPRLDPYFAEMYPPENLEKILAVADVIILSLPLTENSRYLVDRQKLAVMKTNAVLVNISRGAVVDMQALIQWLQESRGSAVLDVFEEEPLPGSSPLWQMDNVIITPHNSFVGEGNGVRLFDVIVRNLEHI